MGRPPVSCSGCSGLCGYFSGWQVSPMGQPQQLLPQEDLFSFRRRIMERRIKPTVATKAAQIRIVARFSESQVNIAIPPYAKG